MVCVLLMGSTGRIHQAFGRINTPQSTLLLVYKRSKDTMKSTAKKKVEFKMFRGTFTSWERLLD
jgi:hypothetical protein